MADTDVRVIAEYYDVATGEYRRKGETFTTSEEFADENPHLVEQSDDPIESGGLTEPPFDPGEYTVDELESRLNDNDYSEEEMAALTEAEKDGENRDGALELLE